MVKNILSVVFLLAAVGAFLFYTKPQYDSLQTLSAQNAQYDAALAKAAQLQSVKQSLLTRYNSFDPTALSRLSTLLPDQVDNIRLILDLDNIASKYGMSLQNVQISTPNTTASTVVGAISEQSSLYEALTLQFSTHGTYEQFKQFLGDLQSSLRIVDLVTLDLAPSTDVSSNPQDPVYTYTMSIQTYWLH